MGPCRFSVVLGRACPTRCHPTATRASCRIRGCRRRGAGRGGRASGRAGWWSAPSGSPAVPRRCRRGPPCPRDRASSLRPRRWWGRSTDARRARRRTPEARVPPAPGRPVLREGGRIKPASRCRGRPAHARCGTPEGAAPSGVPHPRAFWLRSKRTPWPLACPMDGRTRGPLHEGGPATAQPSTDAVMAVPVEPEVRAPRAARVARVAQAGSRSPSPSPSPRSPCRT